MTSIPGQACAYRSNWRSDPTHRVALVADPQIHTEPPPHQLLVRGLDVGKALEMTWLLSSKPVPFLLNLKNAQLHQEAQGSRNQSENHEGRPRLHTSIRTTQN